MGVDTTKFGRKSTPLGKREANRVPAFLAGVRRGAFNHLCRVVVTIWVIFRAIGWEILTILIFPLPKMAFSIFSNLR